MIYPRLTLQHTFPLAHCGDCALIGIDSSGRIAVEEMYDDWYAQHLLDGNGTLIATCDEAGGDNPQPPPLPLLDDLKRPAPIERGAMFNYTAGRWRGLREADRVADTLQPVTVAERIALTAYRIPVPILGIAESYTLAEAAITPDVSLICRRLRIAHGVSMRQDESGLPYDYDTYLLYLTQWLLPSADEAPLDQGMIALSQRPMDLLIQSGDVWVADGGDALTGRRSALHRYQVE